MPFWVYGNDSETGERDRFYSSAADDNAARAEAYRQGLIVERVEMAEPARTDDAAEDVAITRRVEEPAAATADPVQLVEQRLPQPVYVPPSPMRPVPQRPRQESPYVEHDDSDGERPRPRPLISIVALLVAEGLSIIACAISVMMVPGAFLISRRPNEALILALGSLASVGYNLALAAVFRYVREQLQH